MESDEQMASMEKTHGLFIQWLEDFKSRLGHLPEAQPTIKEVEEALHLYQDVVGKVKIPLDIKRAVEARGVLEYGLTWTLEKFTNAVKYILLKVVIW